MKKLSEQLISTQFIVFQYKGKFNFATREAKNCFKYSNLPQAYMETLNNLIISSTKRDQVLPHLEICHEMTDFTS